MILAAEIFHTLITSTARFIIDNDFQASTYKLLHSSTIL